MTHGKEELRRKLRRVRETVPPDQASRAADAAAAHLLALPAVAAARTVGVYAPMRNELSPAPAVRALRERGVALAYPRVLADARILEFHLVGGDDELVPAAFGIREPVAGAPRVALDAVDLFVLPGLAFDDTGTRLGWGRGYYDRTLAAAPGVRVGYCYLCQVLAHVPRVGGDLPVHFIVTEAGASPARV